MLQRPPESSATATATGSIPERSDLVLAFARVLQVNGQSTHETLAAAGRISKRLGLKATTISHWGDLQVQATDGSPQLVSLAAANPTAVNMRRVADALGAIAP